TAGLLGGPPRAARPPPGPAERRPPRPAPDLATVPAPPGAPWPPQCGRRWRPAGVPGCRVLPPPQERSAAARARLMAAASELFYKEGVNAVGIERVLEHAGVAKATLYSAFGSKEG